MSKLKKYITLNFRQPLESDNLNETLRLNRALSNPIIMILVILIVDFLLFLGFNIIVNVVSELPGMLSNIFHNGLEEEPYRFEISELIRMKKRSNGSLGRILYWIFLALVIAGDLKAAYNIRISFSEKALNKGSAGTARWTTLPEVMEQYKEIDMYPSDGEGNTNWIEGKGGVPVTRWRDKLYIDSQLTNNLFLGATRSGKGEMFVFPLIDIFSRAKEQSKRPSMIIFDPKLELYKGSFRTLRKRGYEVRLLNLDNPMKSAGYNPLTIVTEYYKKGNIDEAQQLAKSFSFGIFNSNNDTQEPIWKNTATDLWTAMIIAQVSDCIEADAELNAMRVKAFNKGRKLYTELQENGELSEEELEDRIIAFTEIYFSNDKGPTNDWLNESSIEEMEGCEIPIPEVIPEYIVKQFQDKINKVNERKKQQGKKNELIPEPVEEPHDIRIDYHEIFPNERNINCFSVLNFFKELVDVTSVNAGKEDKAGVKKADNALDDYFNQRPDLDYAKSLYASIKSAGDRTKGSVFINMQSALSIFMQDNIARLTAESDIDIAGLGFNQDHPTAIFIGIPTEDKSNHFLALTFVTQVFQYLWKLSKIGNNKLDREVEFILDEFGNMPVLDNFAGMVTNCLGAGIAFNIFIQSYNQLHSNYDMDMDTIKDNFANQFYILAVGNESANEFSEQLGNRTIIEVQRSGEVLSTRKHITENTKERPLKFPQELQELKEGETCLIRAAKRTDRAGAGVKSHPVLCEYLDKLYPHQYIDIFIKKILIKRFKHKDALKDRDTRQELSARAEYKYWVSERKRYLGTAFMYRWQYATRDFPNPDEINFNEIFNERGREDIDYQSRTVDINKVKEALGIKTKTEGPGSKERTINSLRPGAKAKYINYCSSMLGLDYMDEVGLAEHMTIKRTLVLIRKYIDEKVPPEKKEQLRKEDFLGKLNSILLRG